MAATMIIDPSKKATPRNTWDIYGMRTDMNADIETLKLCYVPIMLIDFLQQYCKKLVANQSMPGMLKKKSNLVADKCSRYLSLISPSHKEHYVDQMLDCFDGVYYLISEDVEKYRFLVMQTMADVYPDIEKRKVYANIWALLLILNTMFDYMYSSDMSPDEELQVIFDIVYSQMITIFDKKRTTFLKKELTDVKQSMKILTNRIDKFIGLQKRIEQFAKEEAAK